MAELEIEDSRVLFMANYVLRMTSQKPEKFTKAYLVEDTMRIYKEFFDEVAKKVIYVFVGASGSFVSQATWPGTYKVKGCYFVKKKPAKIAMDAKLSNLLIYGDMSMTPIEQFSLLLDEVRLGQLH